MKPLVAAEEKRSGDDRRAGTISHSTLYEKLLEHEDAIAAIRQDVSEIKDDLSPISNGITSIVFLFKVTIALGALCAAMLGMFELAGYFKGAL